METLKTLFVKYINIHIPKYICYIFNRLINLMLNQTSLSLFLATECLVRITNLCKCLLIPNGTIYKHICII